MKNNALIPISIVVAGVVIAGAVFFTNQGDGPAVNNDDGGREAGSDNSGEITMAPVTEDDHILGNPNADVIIVEYSDTECPFCKNFHETMNRIMDEYGTDGNVAWVYRHFPLTNIHPKAQKEAEATECAAELGGNDGFWAYINRVFEITPSSNGLDLDLLPEIAEEVGLDRATFEECLDSGRHAQTVEDDLQSALEAGARGTPYSVVITPSGELRALSGAKPYASVKNIIDSLLNTAEGTGE